MAPNEPIANILIVDDDLKTLTAMEALLSGPGRMIVTAKSGREALRCLLRQDFALILLDVRMPEMDGFETAAMIRRNERFRYIPIIFLSAVDTLDEDVIRGVASGAVDYLFKPVVSDVVKTKVSVFVDLFRMNERLKQQAVQQSEERFRLLVDSLQDYAVHMMDPEGRVTTWNPAAERIRGWKQEEIIGRFYGEFYTPEDQAKDQPARALEQAALKGRYEEEGWRMRKDGSRFWANVIVTALRDDSGKLLGFSAVARDLTERKHAEERFKVAVEASPNAMIMIAESGNIVFVNAQAEKLFGYAREDLVGQTIERLVPERFRAKHSDFRGSFFTELKSRPMGSGRDLYGVRKDGSEVPVEIGLNPIERGEGKFVLASIIDITERKRMEEEMRRLNAGLERRVIERTGELVRSIEEREKLQQQLSQAQKMESIGTLAAGIAHDFNNILTIILGYSSSLTDNPGDPAKVREGLEIIRETGMRGALVVQQLLTLARNGNLSFAPTDIDDLLQRFAKLLGETFPKTITVSLDLDPAIPQTLADPNRLHQALLNLCVNARDAMNGSGSLLLKDGTVTGEELRKRFADAGDEIYVCVTVADTGEGMDRTTRERIFDPFFTTKEPGKGTGLGLTAVYGIVGEHDGFIEVDSEPGKGATFRIYLPVRLADGKWAAAPRAEKRAPDAAEGHGTILVVDDEERQLDLIRTLLQDKGYRVLVARDGVEAVEIHLRHKNEIAVVILDLGLPRLSGWDAFLMMKKEQPGVKTIFTSGYIRADVRSEMISQGVTEIIHKPYLPGDLLAKIGAAISAPSALHLA